MTEKSPIAAVVSTYRPNESIFSNLEIISAQVDKVFLVDDSGCRAVANYLQERVENISNFELISNKRNIGLASSLNKAISYAQTHGFEWIIVFDDDTTIKQGAIHRLRNLASSTHNSYNVFCLSRPGIGDNKLSVNAFFTESKVNITSGSMFTLDLFNKIGGFDKSFFIDLLDFDFCLRARAAGGKVLRMTPSEMNHRVGNPSLSKLLFFINITTLNHQPNRYYYQFRSAVLLSKKHYKTEFYYLTKLWAGMTLRVFKLIMLEENKVAKLKLLATGFIHGVFNNFSHNPPV